MTYLVAVPWSLALDHFKPQRAGRRRLALVGAAITSSPMLVIALIGEFRPILGTDLIFGLVLAAASAAVGAVGGVIVNAVEVRLPRVARLPVALLGALALVAAVTLTAVQRWS